MHELNREIIMLPKIVAIVHEGVHYAYNGSNGVHNQSGAVVFQYADEFDQDRIWADVNGRFVCEE